VALSDNLLSVVPERIGKWGGAQEGGINA